MDRHELQVAVQEMHQSAADYVRAYALVQAPHVDAVFVTAITKALGEISIAEAITALDRLERERRHR